MPHQILLVEDDPDARYIYAASMKHARFDVVDAGLARDAVESALASRPDVVVLDRRLPDRDGLDLARQRRASGTSMARVPIIVLTAYTTKADVNACVAAGCDVFLGKPCPGAPSSPT